MGNSGSSALIIPTKNNRIIDHPEILKVSSVILPGDLKAFGRSTSSSAVKYVPEPEDLRISDNPEISGIWSKMVEENLKLGEFARKLAEFSRRYGVINKFPPDILNELRKFSELYNIPDSKNKADKDTIAYNLGFITLNSGIKEEDDSLLVAQFKFNLLFLVSMVNAGIKPVELFNQFKEIDKDNLNKIATGGKLKDGNAFYDYTWKPFKDIRSIAWSSLGKKKVNDFFKKFEFLLNLFQKERISYHEIARRRHAGEKPYMVILKQYRGQFPSDIINFPREYIEQQEPITKYAPEGGKIGDTVKNPGGLLLPGESAGKVRKFTLNGLEFYAKRVNSLWTRYPEEEIMISLKAAQSLKKVSPYFGVQEFIGIVYDQGAFYLLSRAIVSEQPRPPETIRDLNRFKLDVVDSMVRLGMPKHDIQKEVVNKFGEITWVFLDFETFPYRLVKDAAKALEALKSRNNKEKANENTVLLMIVIQTS